MNGVPSMRSISSSGMAVPGITGPGSDSSPLHDSGFGGSFVSTASRGSFGGSSISGGSTQSGGSSSGGGSGIISAPVNSHKNYMMSHHHNVDLHHTQAHHQLMQQSSYTSHHTPQHTPHHTPQHTPHHTPQHSTSSQHFPPAPPFHHHSPPVANPHLPPAHHPPAHRYPSPPCAQQPVSHNNAFHDNHHPPPPPPPVVPQPQHHVSQPQHHPVHHHHHQSTPLSNIHHNSSPSLSSSHGGCMNNRSSISSQDFINSNQHNNIHHNLHPPNIPPHHQPQLPPLPVPNLNSSGCTANNNNFISKPSNSVGALVDALDVLSAPLRHSTDDEILREAFMVKRSQNRSRFGPTNWRERWFVLTPAHLIYYDGDKQSGRRKEKGRVDLTTVEYVERVDDGIFDRQHVFQVAHAITSSSSSDSGGAGGHTSHSASASSVVNCTLYIEASTQLDATAWIHHIRTLVAGSSNLSSHYHPGRPQRNGTWGCCKSSTPCAPITWVPSHIPTSPSKLSNSHQQPIINNNSSSTPSNSSIVSTPPLTHNHHRQQSSTLSIHSQSSLTHASPPTMMVGGDSGGGGAGGVNHHLSTGGSVQANGIGTPDPTQKRIVRALYDYKAAQKGDLSLVQDEEYEVLEETEEHWWRLRDKLGNEGYSPSNYVKECTDIGLHQYDWYLGDATRQRAETILMREEREGCFVVRNSTSTSGMYTISVFCSMSRPQVKHYHIQKDSEGKYYLSQNIKCNSISELIYKHQYNPGGLCTRLRSAPHGNKPPATAGFGRDKWDIPLTEITLMEEIGSGQFGVVRRGRYRGMDVAVKMMKEGTMSEDEFIEEAKVMTKLQHPNLVQLYGVCRRQRPVYIITEFLEYGSLLHYLRQKEKTLSSKTETLIDMCLQIAEGMAYLEKEKFIHRDLAARNCLVGSKNIKVGDFGLARYVVDDEYTGSGGAKFPIKWAAPEVLNYMRFSSKSDVWAFGVLMWEVFTCGKMPYGRRKNADVVAMVQEGVVLDQPRYCPHSVYQVMRECWEQSADQRPSFNDLKTEIGRLNSDE